MQRLGFIHDMLDVKMLILFVMARVKYPVTVQEIYELCYQDDCVSYFDICTAIPQMLDSGHLSQSEQEKYEITPKGRETDSLTADSIAFTVRKRAEDEVDRFNRKARRADLVKTEIRSREAGDYCVTMALNDEMGALMNIELFAPDQRQAVRLSRLMEKKSEMIYALVMAELLDDEEQS